MLLVLALALAIAGATALTTPTAAHAQSGDIGDQHERASPPPPAPSPPTPTVGERAVRFALRAVGTPYRYGGESPASGFDCSGLVRWAYGRLGIDLPHSSYALAAEGRRVAHDELRPGDILVFAGLGHVGIYIGESRMVHAPQTGRTVEVVPLGGGGGYGARLATARRIGRA
jgi:cell wall-associated NlpC family hydrolase